MQDEKEWLSEYLCKIFETHMCYNDHHIAPISRLKGLAGCKCVYLLDNSVRIADIQYCMCNFRVCSTADKWDTFLIIVGVIGGIGSGALLPLFSLVFSRFTNAFGDPASIDFMEVVSDIALQFTYLAIAGMCML